MTRFLTLSQRLILPLLGAILFCSAAGCRSGGGMWRPSWGWFPWSGAAADTSDSVSISRPSTRPPAPVTTPEQVTRGLAGTTNNPSGVSTASANVSADTPAAYPATAQANDYPSRPGANTTPAASGYQVGPYGMQSGPYTGGAAGASASAPAESGGAYGGAEGYRTATQPASSSTGGGAWDNGNQNPAAHASPESNTGAYQPAGAADGSSGAHSEGSVYGPSSGGEGAYSGGGTYQPTGPAEAGSTPGASPSFGPPNTVSASSRSAAATRPAATAPASSGFTLPANLSSAPGGFRPGSTAAPGSRFGVENAGYVEPQNAAAPESGSSSGTTYR